VAEEEGAILGTAMAGYDGHRGWLYSVAVMPSRQAMGIGRSLVEAAKQPWAVWAVARSTCRCALQTRR
jgi:ribosomal protein S18 acetylase RimI-like enzyme